MQQSLISTRKVESWKNYNSITFRFAGFSLKPILRTISWSAKISVSRWLSFHGELGLGSSYCCPNRPFRIWPRKPFETPKNLPSAAIPLLFEWESDLVGPTCKPDEDDNFIYGLRSLEFDLTNLWTFIRSINAKVSALSFLPNPWNTHKTVSSGSTTHKYDSKKYRLFCFYRWTMFICERYCKLHLCGIWSKKLKISPDSTCK